nr:transposase family protein [Desulfovibrio sp.]
MATPYIILKKLMDLNQIRVISFEEQDVPFSFHKEKFMRKRILAHVMPFKSRQSRCPVCGKSCPGYDYQSNSEITWRAPNVNGYEVLLCYRPKRIQCPE